MAVELDDIDPSVIQRVQLEQVQEESDARYRLYEDNYPAQVFEDRLSADEFHELVGRVNEGFRPIIEEEQATAKSWMFRYLVLAAKQNKLEKKETIVKEEMATVLRTFNQKHMQDGVEVDLITRNDDGSSFLEFTVFDPKVRRQRMEEDAEAYEEEKDSKGGGKGGKEEEESSSSSSSSDAEEEEKKEETKNKEKVEEKKEDSESESEKKESEDSEEESSSSESDE
ncbi:Retinitis pigmentosa GTPase regulator a [Balamuthia mandrillaris]